jgi:nucleotide-binding universal stress UspA family protein
MIEKIIRLIICAVRGIPESRKAVTKAIDLALEHDAKLIFCFVIDVEFIGQSAPTLTTLGAAYEQLENLGEFSMIILTDRAKRRGVEDVEYLIRKGELSAQLFQVVKETEADILVIGRPVPQRSRGVFTPADFDAFIEKIEAETGVQVIQVRHELTEGS